MPVRTRLAKLFTLRAYRSSKKWVRKPAIYQERFLERLMLSLAQTKLGVLHWIRDGSIPDTFKKNVPTHSYDELKQEYAKVVNGELNIIWPGKRVGINVSDAGETFPYSLESIKSYAYSYKNALLNFIYFKDLYEAWNGYFLDLHIGLEPEENPKMDVLSWKKAILSQLPYYIQRHMAFADDFDAQQVSTLLGTGRQISQYLNRFGSDEPEEIKKQLPKLALLVVKGSEPIAERLEKNIGEAGIKIQRWLSKDGLIWAYEDGAEEPGLLLNQASGAYYEFQEEADEQSTLIGLNQVKAQTTYKLLYSTNSGLWRCETGVKIQFEQLNPFRISCID